MTDYNELRIVHEFLASLHENGATYKEAETILKYIQGELTEARRSIEYETAADFFADNKCCNADNKTVHHWCRVPSCWKDSADDD